MARGMIDAMAHLHDVRLRDVPTLLARAAAVGVTDVVAAGVDPLQEALTVPDLASQTAVAVWRAAGLHPRAVTSTWRRAVTRLESWLRNGTLVAVGEVGLDGRDGMPEAALQEAALAAQLELARAHRLPVILHNVQRTGRLLDILRGVGPLCAGGMLHGYAGPKDLIAAWADLGLSFSFGGQVAHSRARRVREAATAVPRDLLLVESDTPDHPPTPGGLSQPACIREVLATLAHLRQEAAAELARRTSTNARRLYNLPMAGET